MGQSQILLIILVTALIGAATVVGINHFGEDAVIANRDALARECRTIISGARAFYGKPITQGGGGNSFTGLTFAALGMGSGNRYTSAHGRFALSSTAQTVTCVGTGSEQVADGNDIKVKVVYFANSDSTR